MELKYLTTEEIVDIHNEIIKETGGHTGVISLGNLDFIVSQIEIPRSMERKAATLLYGILTSHPFADGNKRTAFESMKVFLRLNGRSFEDDEEDLWNKLHEISSGTLKFEETVKWVSGKVVSNGKA